MSLKRAYEDVPSEAGHYFTNYSRTWLLRCTTDLYDPIFTPLLTTLFTSSAFGLSAAAAGTLATGISAIATTALSIGVQMLLAPKPPKPDDVKIPKVQSVPYRWWGFGLNRVAGAYMLWEAKGERLFAVQAIAGHKIQSIERYYLHDDEVELNSDNETTGAIGQTEVNTKRYGRRVRIFHRLGEATETPYAEVVEHLGAEGIWTTDHRGDGQASLAMIAKRDSIKTQQARYPFGAPQLSVLAKMALVWDPRDPAQDPENQTTWQWSQNPALGLIWHWCFNEFGHRRDYKKAILPVLDMWIEEANVCDEDVPLAKGGTEKRYQCNIVDTSENDPKAGTNAILASCDGWICERGDGALLFVAGKFREKYCTTVTDSDIAGRQLKYGVLFEDECNRLVPKFCYPDIRYATSDTDFFEDTAAQITAGRVLAQEANYQAVQQWRQARRLGKRDWLRLQEKVSGQINVRLSGINSVYSRWVRVNAPIMLPRLTGKIIENRKSVLSLLQGGFTMDIMKHPDNIDAWSPATDEGRQPPVPPITDPDTIAVPVINLVQAKANGQSVYIRVVIVDPDNDSYTPVVRYHVVNADGLGNAGAWVEQRFPNATPGVPAVGYVDLSTNVVPSDKQLEVQAAFITDEDYGTWSVTASVMSIVPTELVVNGYFDSDSNWSKGTGWTIASGTASHAAGSASNLSQTINFVAGASYQVTYTINSITGGGVLARLAGTTPVDGTLRTAAGTYTDTIVANATSKTLAIAAQSGAVASVTAISVKRTA